MKKNKSKRTLTMLEELRQQGEKALGDGKELEEDEEEEEYDPETGEPYGSPEVAEPIPMASTRHKKKFKIGRMS